MKVSPNIHPQINYGLNSTYQAPGHDTGERAPTTESQGQEASRADIYSGAFNGAKPTSELSRQELQELFKLKQRDQEVKQHEMAHIAAGGPYVRGGAHFEYKRGPDGRRYAVAGEVSIDTSPEKDPRATLQKMRTVQRAALAPAHPSQQDRRVAAQAAAKAIQAMVEIMKESQDEKVRSALQNNGEAGQGDNKISKNLIDIYA